MRSYGFIGSLGAAAVAATLGMFGSAAISMPSVVNDRAALLPQMPVISKPTKRHRTTTKHSRNGKREVARRLRQIAAGQLTRSNGLVSAHEVRWPA